MKRRSNSRRRSCVGVGSVLASRVLPLLSVGKMTLRRYAALNYSQNSDHDLRRALNGA